MEKNEPIIVSLDMKKLVRDNIIYTIVLIFLSVAINALIHQRFSANFNFWDIFIFFVGYILLIIFHEAFHLIGFMLFGKVKYKELDYGVNWELGVAYATTSKPLNNAAMKKALLLPFWTTGVIPTLIGFSIDNFIVVILGAVLIAGAIGDFHMYKELRKYPNNAIVKDDPKEPKLYIQL